MDVDQRLHKINSHPAQGVLVLAQRLGELDNETKASARWAVNHVSTEVTARTLLASGHAVCPGRVLLDIFLRERQIVVTHSMSMDGGSGTLVALTAHDLRAGSCGSTGVYARLTAAGSGDRSPSIERSLDERDRACP